MSNRSTRWVGLVASCVRCHALVDINTTEHRMCPTCYDAAMTAYEQAVLVDAEPTPIYDALVDEQSRRLIRDSQRRLRAAQGFIRAERERMGVKPGESLLAAYGEAAP